MKHLRLAMAVICLLAAVPSGVTLRADDASGRAPNYPLAAQWTIPHFNKLVFDVQVTPHWLEFSDRFWYSYETRDGKRYVLVDPSAAAPRPGAARAGTRGVKAPLFGSSLAWASW